MDWCGEPCGALGELIPYEAERLDVVGREFELPVGPDKRWVTLRIGKHGTFLLGVFQDIQERYRLMAEVNHKTAALEEKVWELSRSKRAILNILEDLEERSRELSKGKEELEVLNENLQRFNRDLERANKDLRSLDEVKSNLLSNVSHELRTPLVAIKGYTELIHREKLGPITEKQKAGLEISLKSLARLIDLINNLLDFSRIEIGKLQLEVTEFSVKELLPEILGIIVPRATERDITVEAMVAGDDVRYQGDRNKIAQVLTNLLTNAVKFNKDGGRVILSVASGDNEIVIRVEDTGIGIQPEHVGRIFERFFQVDSSMTRRQGGTGIGLSIVKSLVELHGGSIQVVSQPGEGSTFFVRLPLLHDR
jgi:signal transduction histidine kinase